MVVMQHHIIDYDYMYNYAIFEGVDGVLRGYVLKPTQAAGGILLRQKSLSTKRNSESTLHPKSYNVMNLRVISGHFLLNENLSIPSTVPLFVQVLL